MQKLIADGINEDGEKVKVPVFISRSWIDSSGKSVFLHQDGRYLDRNAHPFKSLADFDILKKEEVVGRKDNGQLKTREVHSVDYAAAKRWWENWGEAESAEYYNKQQTAQEKLYNQGVPVIPPGGMTELEQAQYSRQPLDSKGDQHITKPATFGKWFDGMPDWWGHADLIEINGYRYRRYVDTVTEN